MINQNPTHLLPQAELERRLLRWASSSYVPLYPFFDGSLTPGTSRSLSSSIIGDGTQIHGDLNRWINSTVELAAGDCGVGEEQHADVAIYFLRGDLQEVMRVRRAAYLKHAYESEEVPAEKRFWVWEDFKDNLKRVVEEAVNIIRSSSGSNMASEAVDLFIRRAHPYVASSVTLGLIIGGTAVLLPALGIVAWNRMRAVQQQVGSGAA